MRQGSCPQEEAVARAVRAGIWDESVAGHAGECEVCGEIVRTSRWMQTLAASAEHSAAALPDASLLWWRAQLAEADRTLASRRRAVEWLRVAPFLLVAAALLAWSAWNWRTVGGVIAWLSSDIWSRIVVVGYFLALAEPNLLWPVLVLASLLVAVVAYPLLERA